METGSQNKQDRFNDLPDSIILHILSFLITKQALQTSILSTRWKNFPKHLPILRLSSLHNKSRQSFGNFVSRVLSLRDHSTTLHTLDLMKFDDFVEPGILKSIVEYAVSHNIKILRSSITCDILQFPPCLFSSQTLTIVDLCVHYDIVQSKILFPNSLNLPVLTTLTLRSFYFCARNDGCAEPFSAFNKLNTLIIVDCQLLDALILCISSVTLVNLTVDECGYYPRSYKCKLYTPSLYNLNYTGTLNQKLCRSNLCSLKRVCIDVNNEYSSRFERDYPFLLNLLFGLANIKSLTVSFSTLQVLSFVPNLFKVKLTSLYNLESLQVKVKPLSTPYYVVRYFNFHLNQPTFEPDRVVHFLIQNSPSTKVNIIYSD